MPLFHQKIQYLWQKRGCLSADFDGYTQLAINRFRKVITFTVKGVVHSSGGEIGHEVQERCYRIMNYWADLALRTLFAEFPSFEFIQAFVVFRLEKTVVKDVELDIYYQRIALVLRLEDAGELKSQTERFRPRALQIWKDTGCTVAEASKRSVDNRNVFEIMFESEFNWGAKK